MMKNITDKMLYVSKIEQLKRINEEETNRKDIIETQNKKISDLMWMYSVTDITKDDMFNNSTIKGLNSENTNWCSKISTYDRLITEQRENQY